MKGGGGVKRCAEQDTNTEGVEVSVSAVRADPQPERHLDFLETFATSGLD